MSNKQKLELTWIGKEKRPRLEPRILVEVPEKSYYAKEKKGDNDQFENMLIHGDNLLALKALEQDFTGKIKCIYIDPPYNTGSAFEHYDDCLDHSIWLGLMRDRLEILWNLLSSDGTISVQIDAKEMAHLKLVMDEVFGRENFINIVCCKAKVAGLSGEYQGKSLQDSVEFILIYSKDISQFTLNNIPVKKQELSSYVQQMKDLNKSWKYTSVLKTIDSGRFVKTITEGGSPLELYVHDSYDIKSVGQIAKEEFEGDEAKVYLTYYNKIFRTTNAQTSIRDRVIDATKDVAGEIFSILYVPQKGKYAGQKIRVYFKGENLVAWLKEVVDVDGGVPYKIDVMGNLWDDIQYNNLTKEGNVQFPNGKKPELLIQRLIDMLSNKGDIVLDSFLGSGTTAAVAHKTGRKWIGIELGEHCYTHCVPRLQRVIDGNDQGGISKAVDWQGGGGFRFFELGESLIQKDKWGQEIINKNFNAEMLAQAVCKIEGFIYAPSKDEYFIHGHSTEHDFIFVTTNFMQAEYLKSISEQVGEARSLLICCKGFEKASEFSNLTVKKIPKAVLDKCEWGHDDYSLNVANLPMSAAVPVQDELFDDIEGDEK